MWTKFKTNAKTTKYILSRDTDHQRSKQNGEKKQISNKNNKYRI